MANGKCKQRQTRLRRCMLLVILYVYLIFDYSRNVCNKPINPPLFKAKNLNHFELHACQTTQTRIEELACQMQTNARIVQLNWNVDVKWWLKRAHINHGIKLYCDPGDMITHRVSNGNSLIEHLTTSIRAQYVHMAGGWMKMRNVERMKYWGK